MLAPFWLPKCFPLGTLLALKIDQKNDPKMDCLKGRSKIAPRAPKTLPRRPPDPPWRAPRGFREPLGWLFLAVAVSGCGLCGSWLPIIRNRREHVEKKKSTTVIHSGHSHWPLKSRKHCRNCRNPEGGGGGCTKRSSIYGHPKSNK